MTEDPPPVPGTTTPPHHHRTTGILSLVEVTGPDGFFIIIPQEGGTQ